MRTSTLAFVASALVGLSTQTTVSDLPFTVDISSISISDLNSWCSGQIHVCDVLCSENTKTNSCVEGPPPVWDCACSSNSSAPGAQYYSSSMQAQLCQKAFAQCQSTNAGDAEAQKTECEDGIQAQCGTLDISKVDTDSGEETASKTTANKATATATETSSTPTATNDDAGDLAPSVPIFATGGIAVLMVAFFAQLI
jgi:hypothetical protein